MKSSVVCTQVQNVSCQSFPLWSVAKIREMSLERDSRETSWPSMSVLIIFVLMTSVLMTFVLMTSVLMTSVFMTSVLMTSMIISVDDGPSRRVKQAVGHCKQISMVLKQKRQIARCNVNLNVDYCFIWTFLPSSSDAIKWVPSRELSERLWINFSIPQCCHQSSRTDEVADKVRNSRKGQWAMLHRTTCPVIDDRKQVLPLVTRASTVLLTLLCRWS